VTGVQTCALPISLSAQGDQLWWGAAGFAELAQPYGGFRMVVAGASPQRGAQPYIARHVACIDGGAGQGGPLNVACFALDATLSDSFAI
jgi:serine/threonine protein phosphatase 1